ncbi:MAG TPA: ATP-binding cassette domain-containing protein [Pseudonocardiaceae bacterium]|nr:ATP-binding cassette domain-containing protein [Pseudonocardiaceae bacterium]
MTEPPAEDARATEPIGGAEGMTEPIPGAATEPFAEAIVASIAAASGATEPIGGPGGITEPLGLSGDATEPPVADGSTTQPLDRGDSATEPIGDGSATEPIGGDSGATEPIGDDSGATEPIGAGDSATEPIGTESGATEPIDQDDGVTEPIGDDGGASEPPAGADPASEPDAPAGREAEPGEPPAEASQQSEPAEPDEPAESADAGRAGEPGGSGRRLAKAAPTRAISIAAAPATAAPTKSADTRATPAKSAETSATPTKAAPAKPVPTKPVPATAVPAKADRPRESEAKPTAGRQSKPAAKAKTSRRRAKEPLLVASGLNRTFRLPQRSLFRAAGFRYAVRDVRLSLAEGGSLGIVGESGSGKSTLLRLLLALDRADSGTVRYRGQEVRYGPPGDLHWFRREVQVVFQDPLSSLDPRATVRDIVAEPLECLGVPGDHDRRVDEVLTAVGLEPSAALRYPHEFSGGQRQRIAIARALAPKPRVLVADEPFSALDTMVRAQVIELVRSLVAELGLSLILVSHDIAVVNQLCDQLVVLRQGEVVERGPSATVLSAPAHPYTRTLLSAIPRLPE